MTNKFDIKGLQDHFLGSAALTTAMVLFYSVGDEFTDTLKWLTAKGTDIEILRSELKNLINDELKFFDVLLRDETGLSSMSVHDKETGYLFKMITEKTKATGVVPDMEEVIDMIFTINQEYVTDKDEDPYFINVIHAFHLAGYKHESIASGIQIVDKKYAAINKYCDDLTTQAQKKRIEALIGRQDELQRTIEILSHKNKKNPILVGPAGVGKTAIIEGLAKKIVEKDVPESLIGARIISTTVGRLLAGSKFRGELEERAEALVKEVTQFNEESEAPVFLFIDEIHQIIGAGNNGGQSGGADIANIFKPALSRGKFALIGATTDKEYKQSIQKDSALDRRFQKVIIGEPSDEDTYAIVKQGVVPSFEDFHGIDYPVKVIKSAIKLTSKYMNDKYQPDKTISVLDSVGAKLKLEAKRKRAKVSDVEEIVSIATKTPVSAFQESKGNDTYVDIEKELKSQVYGQDEAVTKISEIYERSKAGLAEEGQPIGSILAVGPTGVGKTQVAKSLAEVTQSHFFKINMGEYTEKHSVSKLFGAPPGYVGHEDGGLLTNEIRKFPHTVLLLDEIEKAHPKVFESLLGIIDGAKMTDGEGNEVDFRNVMIVMTSNAGAADSARKTSNLGLMKDAGLLQNTKAKISKKALTSTFAPEFLNKLTAVVNFSSLGTEVIDLVTNKFLKLAQDTLKSKKGIEVSFTDSVRDYISTEGFDPKFGARPIKKLIDTVIVDSLVRPILKGEIKSGDSIVFDVRDEEVVFNTQDELMEVE